MTVSRSSLPAGDSISRRRFLAGFAAAAGLPLLAKAQTRPAPELAGQVGITSASLAHQMNADSPGRMLELWDLPRVMRDELGMKVLDLNTKTLGSRDPRHVDRFRAATEAAGCVITNLKVNDVTLEFEHDDPAVRRPALKEYKVWIETAARLGARWLRPMPALKTPTFSVLVESYRELADFAGEHRITLLVENYRWIEPDPTAIPRLIEALDRRIAASCDTANWVPEVRYDALARSFPYAVTCDFKPRGLLPTNEHPAFDLRRCFEIGWRAGFRGPWCIEQLNPDSKAIFRQLKWLKLQLETWIREAA